MRSGGERFLGDRKALILCSENPRIGDSIDGTAAAQPRLRRLSTGFAGLGADRLGADPHRSGGYAVLIRFAN
jgi:hypothetical protein